VKGVAREIRIRHRRSRGKAGVLERGDEEHGGKKAAARKDCEERPRARGKAGANTRIAGRKEDDNKGGDRRQHRDLEMPGEDLHRHRRRAEKGESAPRAPDGLRDAEQYERQPGRRVLHGGVRFVRREKAGKHIGDRPEEGGRAGDAEPFQVPEHQDPGEREVREQGQIGGRHGRQGEVQDVQRIEGAALGVRGERGSAAREGVPEGSGPLPPLFRREPAHRELAKRVPGRDRLPGEGEVPREVDGGEDADHEDRKGGSSAGAAVEGTDFHGRGWEHLCASHQGDAATIP